MKRIATLCLVLAILAGCKKDNTSPNNSSNNSNNNNSNNNNPPGNTRSGLGLIADPNATNYAVIITRYNDTIIWQNTDGDSISQMGGVAHSFPSLRPVAYFMMTTFYSVHPQLSSRFEVDMELRDTTAPMSDPECRFGDSIVTLGTHQLSENTVRLAMRNNDNYDLRTEDNNLSAPFEIVSVKHVASASGCDIFRVKARFSNVILSQAACQVDYNVKQAEFEMDFKM